MLAEPALRPGPTSVKIRFIINPRSGSGRNRIARHATITQFIATHAINADVVTTRAAGHATQLAREAVILKCTHVVCVGGDGTINEVAQALIDTTVILVLAPNGSGNGLARHLGLSTSLPHALRLLLNDSQVALIDTGTVNGRFFCNVMGLGFDAEISARFNGLTRRGIVSYLIVSLRCFLRRGSEVCQIDSDEGTWSQRAFIVAVANSEQYGNNARIAPGASVQDGRLDLVAVSPFGVMAAVPLIARLFLGRIDQSAHVLRTQSVRFRITRSRPGVIHTDGEVHAADAVLNISVHPRSLRVLIAPSCAVGEGGASPRDAHFRRDAHPTVSFPQPFSTPVQRFLFLALFLLALGLFSALAQNIWSNGSITAVDFEVLYWMRAHQSSSIDALMIGASFLASFSVVTPSALAGAVYFIHRRAWAALATLVLAVPGGTLLNLGLKSVFHRMRPAMETTVVAMTDYSFPSGHTVAATVFFGLFATIIVSQVTTKRLKFTVTFSAIGMVLAVALSRVYLRVHYLSDVLAGIALGVAWLSLSLAVGRAIRSKLERREPASTTPAVG